MAWVVRPHVIYGVKYIGLVSLGMTELDATTLQLARPRPGEASGCRHDVSSRLAVSTTIDPLWQTGAHTHTRQTHAAPTPLSIHLELAEGSALASLCKDGTFRAEKSCSSEAYTTRIVCTGNLRYVRGLVASRQMQRCVRQIARSFRFLNFNIMIEERKECPKQSNLNTEL